MANYLVTTNLDSGDDGTVTGDLAAETTDGGGLIVTTTLDVVNPDDGETSLREAILLVNAGTLTGTITFASGAGEAFENGGEIDLRTGKLSLTGAVTIDGDLDDDGSPDVTIDAQSNSRVFDIYGTSVASLTGLTITGGLDIFYGAGINIDPGGSLTLADSAVTGNDAGSSGTGGGIHARSATLSISNSEISGNSADQAAGISSTLTTLTIDGSEISGNTSDTTAGGIGVYGTNSALITNSTISGNTARITAAGIFNSGSTNLVLLNSTISDNTATLARAGGVATNDGTTILVNSTVEGNSSNGEGGGVYAVSTGTITLLNSTVTGNSSGSNGGGAATTTGSGGTINAYNSIILGNSAPTDAETSGPNITLTSSINTGSVASVFAAVDGVTGGGLLADNGGPVQTIALLAGGAAIDAGDQTQLVEATIGVDLNGDGDQLDTITTDAIGNARVVGNNVDLGAVESTAVTEGDDFVVGSAGNDTIDALGGSDLVLAGDGNDSVGGGEGVDALAGEGGNDTLDGGLGNDLLSGGEGDDVIYGGDDDDVMTGGTGADSFFGGDGNDTVTYESSTVGVTVDLTDGSANTGDAEGDVFDGVERINGSTTDSNAITGDAASNTIVGGDAADLLDGGAGNDTLQGGGGSDILLGGDGNDSISGGEGVDALSGGTGNDTLDGGVGNDLIVGGEGDDVIYGGDDDDVMIGGAGADSFFGGDGNDTVSYETSLAGVTIHLTQGVRNTGEADGDVFDGVEQIIGSSTGANTITGDAGSNTLVGGSAADRLVGGAGNDTLVGGEGSDQYTIDSLDDVVIENADEGFDRILSPLSITLVANVEAANLLGTDDLDATGNELANWLQGNSGNNSLIGLDGNDRLEGKDGDDVLIGGEGNDNLQGGAGNDIFVIEANAGIDLIRDFTQGEDVIDLTGVPATFDDLSILQIGTSTHILHPGGRIVLNNFTATDIVPEDFFGLRLGTEGNDVLTVTDGPVRIEGLGGDDLLRAFNGAATLEGGTGDDAYFVFNPGTVITELADEGTDRVYAAIDYTLADNIELGAVQGTNAVNLTGNDLDNNLRGNAATNELRGGLGTDFLRGQGGDDTLNGGEGIDILSGGEGADRFEFSANGDLDLVIDFEDGIDTLFIDPVGLGFEDLTIIDFIEDTLVDYGSGRFIVEGVAASQLTEADFGFTFFFPPLE